MKALFRMFLLAGCALAQTLPQAQFAIEIAGGDGGPPTYIVLDGRSGRGMWLDHRQSATLRLDYKVDGRVVRIAAFVLRGKLDGRADSAPIDTLPWQKAGSYSAVLNQAVTLHEMAQLGFEPVTLNIVPAQPPPSVHPPALSKAPSIRIEIVGEDRNAYTVAVHNMSPRTVTSFIIEMFDEDNNGRATHTTSGRHLIAPGGSYRTYVNRMPSMMTLDAVYFKDGSYEGNPSAASVLAARDDQRQRVDNAIAEIMADAASGEEAKIARIRSLLADLPKEPEPQAVVDLRSRFPGLVDADIEHIKYAMKGALDVEKRSVTQTLDQLRPGTLALWWKAMQQR